MITDSFVFRREKHYWYLSTIMDHEEVEKTRHVSLGVADKIEPHKEQRIGYYQKKNGVWEVFGYYEDPADAREAMSGVDKPMLIYPTESQARAALIGYALVSDLVLVGNDPPSCESVIEAFAKGLQEGCFMIGPGGPVFTPITFPR